jgi:acyl-coenzyme A synthetase/AMP-(fatty) acid ligase
MFGEIPVALIVPTSDESMPTLDAVQRYLAQQLPRHKTVREVHQVQQLEKTSSGKIRRRELARRLEEDR